MTELGPSTEEEMVLAFLSAEIDSSRFGQQYRSHLAAARLDRTRIIGQADLSSAADNSIRAMMLSCVRGYGTNSLLFSGFPSDVDWRRVSLTSPELSGVKYANYVTWCVLTRNTRLVGDGAANLGQIPPWTYPQMPKEIVERVTKEMGEIEVNVKAVSELIKSGLRFAELIAVQMTSGDLVLVEGHTRATAFVVSQYEGEVKMLVGKSASIASWAFC